MFKSVTDITQGSLISKKPVSGDIEYLNGGFENTAKRTRNYQEYCCMTVQLKIALYQKYLPLQR